MHNHSVLRAVAWSAVDALKTLGLKLLPKEAFKNSSNFDINSSKDPFPMCYSNVFPAFVTPSWNLPLIISFFNIFIGAANKLTPMSQSSLPYVGSDRQQESKHSILSVSRWPPLQPEGCEGACRSPFNVDILVSGWDSREKQYVHLHSLILIVGV